MKLDKDLVRDIMLAIEADSDTAAAYITVDLPGHDQGEVSYHVMLLNEGGFLKAVDLSDKDELLWYPLRLTYSGHAFLDTIRDGEVWRRTKVGAEKVGGASVAFLWELAKAEAKAKLGLP